MYRKIEPEIGIKRHLDTDDDKSAAKKLREESVLDDIK